jgi:hypothetical protein
VKKLFSVLTLALALNFIIAVGGVAWLKFSGHLDRARALQIRQVLFPPPATQPVASAEVAAVPTTQPVKRLEDLLARESGKSVAEQSQLIQNSIDMETAQLDRRRSELEALKTQLDLAQHQLVHDRATVEADRTTLQTREQEAQRLAADKGFQDSLALYTAMPAPKVKQVFMGLDDSIVVNYLEAMQPRTAAKIIKEFKLPDETTRIQRILEKMRTSQLATAPTASAAPAMPPVGAGESLQATGQ